MCLLGAQGASVSPPGKLIRKLLLPQTTSLQMPCDKCKGGHRVVRSKTRSVGKAPASQRIQPIKKPKP